jgi:arylsulfatase A-like enzyme
MRIIITISWIIIAVNSIAFHAAGQTRQADQKPNVIVIYSDDQGTIDLGVLGSKDLHTPSLDKLFREGVTLTSFYAPAPVCSPSRAGMLTGRVPHRAQLAGNVKRNHPTAGMPTEQVTIAEMLKDFGYATAHIGKWHLGHAAELLPNGQGFDYSFGHHGGCIDNYSHFMYWSGPNDHDLFLNGKEVYRPGEYFPDLMVDHATKWIDENSDTPFFMYFAINLPHYPYQGEPAWLKRYADEGLTTPRLEYAAFISSMDQRIGQLLNVLEDKGIADNTIVIYQSDHGHSTEERAFFGGGNAGPYRGAKFSLLEGGLRVPAAIRWPKGLPVGQVRDQVATGCDWLPTIAALVGCPLPDRRLDGKNLVDLLHDPDAPSPHKVLHWAQKNQWAVRQGDWKLVANAVDTTDGRARKTEKGARLYLLSEDPGETNDLAEKFPDRVKEMTRLHQAWVQTREQQ